MPFSSLLAKYGLTTGTYSVAPTGSGLINHTYLVKENNGGKKYIFQQINTAVFKMPENIAENIQNIADYLAKNQPGYMFLGALPAFNGHYLVTDSNGAFYRLFPFAEGCVSYDSVQTPELARRAAAAFGEFTFLLKDYPANNLHTTLPDFHNLTLRYQQFEQALTIGNKERINHTKEIARQLTALAGIEATYREIGASKQFHKRVTHHDTKISNVLFDEEGNTLCVIDLDTVMPGYFISDVGDMMRNYLSPANEEETDFSAIRIRMDYFEAIATGYLGEMGSELTSEEKAHFVYSGKFLTYMQALRFYTDYLRDDIYYPVKHPGHNLVRTQNQLVLLEKIIAGERDMQELVADISKANNQ